MATLISTFREPVRAWLLDTHPTIKQYAVEEIDAAVKTVIKYLRSSGKEPDIKLNSDESLIQTTDDHEVTYDSDDYGKAWARIVLRAAKMFCDGNSAQSSYRTRALSESFGANRDFVFELLSMVYDLEYGEGGE